MEMKKVSKYMSQIMSFLYNEVKSALTENGMQHGQI